MRFTKFTLLLLISASLLAACGLRGPLYLPDDEKSGQAATQQDAEKDPKKEKEDDSNR